MYSSIILEDCNGKPESGFTTELRERLEESLGESLGEKLSAWLDVMLGLNYFVVSSKSDKGLFKKLRHIIQGRHVFTGFKFSSLSKMPIVLL